MYRIIGADGREYGPVGAEQLRQWLAEGRINQQTRLRAEDSAEWKTLADFPEVSSTTPAPPLPPVRPHVPNHLVPSILATLFCCLPFGIVAIVNAAQVNSKLAGGDVMGATLSSKRARQWCWASVGGWALAAILYFLFFGAMVVGSWHYR